jgi:hypothetical protein
MIQVELTLLEAHALVSSVQKPENGFQLLLLNRALAKIEIGLHQLNRSQEPPPKEPPPGACE